MDTSTRCPFPDLVHHTTLPAASTQGTQPVSYLEPPLYPGFIDPEAPTSPPEPDTGTVWVTSQKKTYWAAPIGKLLGEPGPSTPDAVRKPRRKP
jgi:hypothetical protein